MTKQKLYIISCHHLDLTREMIPTLYEVVGEDNVIIQKAITGAEDFSFYANKVPSLFLFLGGMAKDKTAVEVTPHHTPDFYIDESGMKLGCGRCAI